MLTGGEEVKETGSYSNPLRANESITKASISQGQVF
jgi:hypothetical protein